MASPQKTKAALIAEIKKLRERIKLLEKKITSPVSPPKLPKKKDKNWAAPAFKHSANTIVVIDKQFNIIYINKASKRKAIGLKAYDFNTDESKAIIKNAIKKVFEIAKPQEYTVWSISLAGKLVYTSCKATALIEEKKVTAVIIEATNITKEMEAQNALKQSEEKFKKLSESAFEGIVIHQKGKIVEINKAFLQLSEYTEKQVIGESIFQFIDKSFHQTVTEKLQNKEEKVYEIEMLKNGNKPFWAEISAREIEYKGERARVVAIRDINLQREYQKKLQLSEERFKIISNATFEGIVFSDNGKIIDANEQFLKMYGYKTIKEILGKNVITDFIVPKQQNEAKRLIRLPVSELFEVDTLRKDGSIIPVISKGQNIPYFGRTIRATVIYDITQRKKYEHDLRESERKLSTLMNNLPGIAYRSNYDERWTMHFISKGFYQLTGYFPKDFINNKKRAFSDIMYPLDKNLGLEQIKYALKNHTPFEIEYRIITKNGEIKWVWEKGEGVFSEDGTLLFLEGFITDVNDKKQYELELTKSRENYKSLIDYSPDGVIIHIDGKIKFANPSALNIIGVESFEELENISAFDYILPEHHKQTIDRLIQTKAGKELDFIAIKIKNKKGEIKELETKPILIKYNGMDSVQVVFHDITTQKQLLKEQLRTQIAEETNQKLQQEITERKNTERVLQYAQKYTRLLIDSSLNIICASDKNGYVNEFNKAAQKIFGYELHEVVGKHVKMLYSGGIRTIEKELYANGVFSGEIKYVKKNGEQFDAYLSASLLKNEEGFTIGVMGISHDISERTKIEEQMRSQTAKLNSIIENSSHLIWTVDRNKCLTLYNKNFEEYIKSQYHTEAAIGVSIVSGKFFSTEEHNDLWIEKYNAALRGKAQYFETAITDKHNNLTWREIFLNPIFDANKNVVEVSGMGLDITEKKESEDKIKQSLQEKEILLKEVHHRVKNNLQVISSILNLQSSYVKDESTLNILKESQNRIKSMSFIHESLYQTKDFSNINFSEYVSSLLHNLVHSYSNIDHEIKLNVDIQLIFLNLDLAIPCGLIINEIISNTLKYAFIDKSENAEITLKMQTKGENIRLTIGDNGIGLPQHINYRNTESLGLQLVVTLTDQINGVINIDTKKGTIYTIEFKQNQIKNRI